MSWEAFVSAPVCVDDFVAARKTLSKILGNIVVQPQEPRFRRIRTEKLTKSLFPEAVSVLNLVGFQQQGEWFEFPDEAVQDLPVWVKRLGEAQWEHIVPRSVQQVLYSGFLGPLDLLRSLAVCKQFRRDSTNSLVQIEIIDTGDLSRLLQELFFDGWFHLHCETTVEDPIKKFHDAIVGQPLTCFAGGHKRLQRVNHMDICVPDATAFGRLNPWDMLKVGPQGHRPKPSEPSQEWWAKLNALLRATSDMKGRQWQWSELSALNGRGSTIYIRHVIYCLTVCEQNITVTMRAIWDSAG